MTDSWKIVNRLLSRDEALKQWPEGGIKPNNGGRDWCRVNHPEHPGNSILFCTRPNGHSGPHADYYLADDGYLIWGRIENESKAPKLEF